MSWDFTFVVINVIVTSSNAKGGSLYRERGGTDIVTVRGLCTHGEYRLEYLSSSIQRCAVHRDQI